MTGRIALVRHGRTEWSESGRHTGLTDVPLTAAGEDQGRALGPLLTRSGFTAFGLILSSHLVRAGRTAELAGLSAEVDGDLVEWDYGGYEGRTTAEISTELGRPWSIWAEGVVPGPATPGESIEDVAARSRRVLARVAPVLERGDDAALVAHGHLLRILTTCWLGLPPADGALFALDAGSLSVLRHEHGRPVISTWNRTPGC